MRPAQHAAANGRFHGRSRQNLSFSPCRSFHEAAGPTDRCGGRNAYRETGKLERYYIVAPPNRGSFTDLPCSGLRRVLPMRPQRLSLAFPHAGERPEEASSAVNDPSEGLAREVHAYIINCT